MQDNEEMSKNIYDTIW